MKQMSQNNPNKYGPRMQMEFPQRQQLKKQEDKPSLVNPITKTWYEWDDKLNKYVNTNKSI